MVIIYIPEGKDFPIPNYLELVEWTREEPKNYAVIKRHICACKTPHHIAVCNRSIFIQNENLYVSGLSAYKIDCDTEEEFDTSIFWLVKSKFYTPDSPLIKYFRERTRKIEYTKKPTLTSKFHKIIQHLCGCVEFRLDRIPVYCLEHIVLCGHKKGPTISSVL